jgi:hypothetical protein
MFGIKGIYGSISYLRLSVVARPLIHGPGLSGADGMAMKKIHRRSVGDKQARIGACQTRGDPFRGSRLANVAVEQSLGIIPPANRL